jgi:hypothetical protein
MGAILAADSLVVGDPTSRPVSLTLDRGEILGLLFVEGRPRTSVLRALAGLDAPRGGVVHGTGAPRVVLVSPGTSRAPEFSAQPDVVVLDGLADVDHGRGEHDAWARLAGERERGTAIVVATTSVEQAYRSDRVTLAQWNPIDLDRELWRLLRCIRGLVADSLELFARPAYAPGRSSVSDLWRLTRAARHLLVEARSLASNRDEKRHVEEVGAELAGVSLDDNVLESLVSKIEDAP